MKKFIFCLVSLVLILGATACSSELEKKAEELNGKCPYEFGSSFTCNEVKATNNGIEFGCTASDNFTSELKDNDNDIHLVEDVVKENMNDSKTVLPKDFLQYCLDNNTIIFISIKGTDGKGYNYGFSDTSLKKILSD